MNYIIISVPKSGTYFLAEIVKQFYKGQAKIVFLKAGFGNEAPETTIRFTKKDFAKIKSDAPQILLCHWEYKPELLDFINTQELKPIFIYRNPIGVTTSFVLGGMRGLFKDVTLSKLKKLPTDDDRFLAFIKGISNLKNHPTSVGLETIYNLRTPWIDHVPSFKYEDLCLKNTDSLIKLADVLGTDLRTINLVIDDALKADTITKRNGVAYSWVNDLPETTKEKLIFELKDLHTSLGYQL